MPSYVSIAFTFSMLLSYNKVGKYKFNPYKSKLSITGFNILHSYQRYEKNDDVLFCLQYCNFVADVISLSNMGHNCLSWKLCYYCVVVVSGNGLFLVVYVCLFAFALRLNFATFTDGKLRLADEGTVA